MAGLKLAALPRAVLFDVDFTLLQPTEMFYADGYRRFGERFGLDLDVGRWDEAERAAYIAVKERRAGRGNAHDDGVYSAIAEVIVATMGGGDRAAVSACAAAIIAEWARTENFTLYDDVRPCLERLRAAGLSIGLVSNSERDLSDVLEHFYLGDLIDGAVTSVEVGVMKPAPGIFAAALDCVGAAASDTVMVGDSYDDDVRGALGAGLAAGVLLDRRGGSPPRGLTIHTLAELPPLLGLS